MCSYAQIDHVFYISDQFQIKLNNFNPTIFSVLDESLHDSKWNSWIDDIGGIMGLE